MTDFGRDLERARRAYTTRDARPGYSELYDPIGAAALFRLQERDWRFADLLRGAGIPSLGGLDLLEVGCGSGASLARFVGLGAAPDRLAGIDLSSDRIEAARRLLPQADLRIGSAHELPFADASFDVVAQLTLFSSVLDDGLQAAIAAEMRRVLRDGGVILWYDAFRASPSPDFRPLPAARLQALFPDSRIERRAVTLRWKLLYRVVPRSRWLALALERLPACCSHHAALIRPARPGTVT